MTATTHRVVGGPIVSPRHSDRAIHARSMGASRFDVIRLATPEYHIGMDGTDNLTEDTLQDCGYSTIKATVDDVMVCYNDIILVHHKVMELWYNVMLWFSRTALRDYVPRAWVSFDMLP